MHPRFEEVIDDTLALRDELCPGAKVSVLSNATQIHRDSVRRALLRAKIDRIGLGGYLHLLNDFPDFVEYIADISDEFRAIKELHTMVRGDPAVDGGGSAQLGQPAPLDAVRPFP